MQSVLFKHHDHLSFGFIFGPLQKTQVMMYVHTNLHLLPFDIRLKNYGSHMKMKKTSFWLNCYDKA